MDGDGNLEVFVGSWYDGQTGSTGGVYGFDHDGTTLPGWPQLANHVSVIASPALADLDGDGNLEIITGTYETVARMCVWHHDGTAMSGWPYAIPRGSSSTSAVTSSPAVCDLDGDGALEIVDGTCGQCGTMYAWRRDGTVLSGWPAFTNCVVDGSSPAIGDVDGDGQLEIVVGSGSGFTPYGCTVQISKAYIYRRDGTVLSGWPVDLGTATIPSPALADADGDGSVEIFMAFANLAWCWDAPGAYAADRTPWPYFHLGIDHTGNFAAPDPASTGEPVTDGIARLLVRPNPVSTGPVSFRLPDGRPAQRVDVYAPSGSLVRRVQEGSWDGRDGAGNPVPGGIYFLRNGGDEGPGVRLVVLR